MAFEMDMPDKMDGDSNFLSEPGTYHFAVLAVDEQPTNRDGKPLDGFKVHCCVLDGTTVNQAKKELELMFFAPKLTDKNNGEFAKRKQARFAMATGILPQAAPGQRVSVDLQQAAGRQFVAEVERGTGSDGQPTKFLQLAWANIYHVDDPAVAAVPKDAAALALLPKELRKTAKDFEKKPASGGGNGSKPATATTAQPATAGAVDLNDL
jgi:hypothetical protein